MTEVCLASSTRPRRRNLQAALAQYTVSHFRSSSTKSSSWFLSSLVASFRFEDDDENEDQVELLLIVRMLKFVTMMA